jgi:hypothetical protein
VLLVFVLLVLLVLVLLVDTLGLGTLGLGTLGTLGLAVYRYSISSLISYTTGNQYSTTQDRCSIYSNVKATWQSTVAHSTNVYN